MSYWMPDDSPWTVTTNPVGDSVHVQPVKGMVGTSRWTQRHRREYPRTERQLVKALAACQKWCGKENTKIARGKALAALAQEFRKP